VSLSHEGSIEAKRKRERQENELLLVFIRRLSTLTKSPSLFFLFWFLSSKLHKYKTQQRTLRESKQTVEKRDIGAGQESTRI
jgi:hypothetical protein